MAFRTDGTGCCRPELISPKTDAFIRSQLLWLKGDIDESNQLLGALTPDNDEEFDALRRAATETMGGWSASDAAKVALDRLALQAPGGNCTSSTIFDLLSAATEQRLASELRRTEPSSDWHAWLSLNRAYRQGRPAVLNG